METDSADASADAVALAIRDLTEEVRKFRVVYLTVAGAFLTLECNRMTPTDYDLTMRMFTEMQKHL